MPGKTSRLARLAALLAFAAGALGAAATPVAALQGPGEEVLRPAPMCAGALSCNYVEMHPRGVEGGWLFQSLSICGANCSTQYWVTSEPAGQTVLALPPVRGGGIVATRRPSGPGDRYPAIRTIMPDYGPGDAMCCPSNFRDTTYRYEAAQGQLVPDQTRLIPTASFPGWDELRQSLQADGFELVFGG